jgi:hypothetical protein
MSVRKGHGAGRKHNLKHLRPTAKLEYLITIDFKSYTEVGKNMYICDNQDHGVYMLAVIW